MSKGGGTTKTVSDPWKPAQPYVLGGLDFANTVMMNPPDFYSGQTYNGPSDMQMGAWNDTLGYMDSVFGNQPTLRYGDATQATTDLLKGGGQGALASDLRGTGTDLLTSGWNQYGRAGGLDATGAINSMLSGTPDYSGLQGAVDAANAPILRQFNEEILPGLNSRSTFLGNDTGGIKSLNRVMPEMGARMAQNAQALYNQERLRALGSRDAAAGMVAAGGQNANQLGLGYGNLLGNLYGGAGGDMARGLGMFGDIGRMGMLPSETGMNFADWMQGYDDKALMEDMARFQHYEGQPQDMATWFNSIVNGTAGLGGTGTSKAPTNYGQMAGNALGGAAMGSALASSGALGGLSAGWGAGLGALIGLL